MPPTLLIDSLQTLRRKMKVFAVVYGTGIVIASAVALLLAVVLLDWVLALPAPLRVAVNLAALGTLGYALYHWIGREAVQQADAERSGRPAGARLPALRRHAAQHRRFRPPDPRRDPRLGGDEAAHRGRGVAAGAGREPAQGASSCGPSGTPPPPAWGRWC